MKIVKKRPAPWTAKMISIGLILVAVIFFLLILSVKGTTARIIFGGIGAVLLIVATIFDMVYCTCPYCGHYLGRHIGEFCPDCGKKIEETEQ